MDAPAVNAGTPGVRVIEGRGLAVRDIAGYRHPTLAQALAWRITRHRHDAVSRRSESRDPRLHVEGRVNFAWQSSLGGVTVRTQNADAGICLRLNDVQGRPLLALSRIRLGERGDEDVGEAVVDRFHYEPVNLPGRLLGVTEQVMAGAERCSERLIYAEATQASRDRNLAGLCNRHYDPAGLLQLDEVALTGEPLVSRRRLLASADDANAQADWQGEDASAWEALLAPPGEAYVSHTRRDATGLPVSATDACGHRQRLAYDLAGHLLGSWLTLQGRPEQPIVAVLHYSAGGHKLHEAHGNGISTRFTFDPRSLQLTGILVQRPASAPSGARTLQHLRYSHDPVGNVLRVRNEAEAARYWRNQNVMAEGAYVYDSLYQLIEASGREMAGAARQGTRLPELRVPVDQTVYSRYTRHYCHDSGNNLTHMHHRAPASGNDYSVQLTVSDRSNRAVLAQPGLLPGEVDALFDAAGHQCALLLGQPLQWTARGELSRVSPIQRDEGADDCEWYRYAANGTRLLKVTAQASATARTERVVYLDGLELRSKWVAQAELEQLQVITVAAGGGAEVRVLHWSSGKPAELENDQLRYSYHDLIGSSGLEVNGRGDVISLEEYYPYGGTAVWAARSRLEASLKTIRYSGKERDATGLYYYGSRYYLPWAGRWLSADMLDDDGKAVDGLNLYRMVGNNPMTLHDPDGREGKKGYIYLPVVGNDTVQMAVGDNFNRYVKGRDLRPVILPDRTAKKAFEGLKPQYILGARSELERAENLRRMARAGALPATTQSAYLEEAEYIENEVNIRLKVLKRLKVHSNAESGLLSRLAPGGSKLYISAHGEAGSGRLAATYSPESAEIWSDDLAQELEAGGLPKDFQDIRVSACWSANAVEIESFDSDEIDRSAFVATAVGDGDDQSGPSTTPRPFNVMLHSELTKKGFSKISVTGYSGTLWTYPDGKHYVSVLRSADGITTLSARRSSVKRVHPKPKSN
ncbi:RHS repeat-associated core domain-containing protein [Pseudomonas wayambapalatensis]|uniref:RHS repeat-associated core domain-containing protein n=1 Tax=Pseudomonas wayambapalatensis TaxID=485895 RepID=UPI003CEE62B4